jgi:hypothetical protein
MLVASVVTIAPVPARAQPDGSDAKNLARWHFHRGLTLFNQGDNDGAAAEFRRAYELVPNARVKYNLGLTYAAMGAPVDAVQALETLVEDATLSAEQREHVRTVVEEQKRRIGPLSITTNVAGALIEIDGVPAGRTPLARPVPVAVGRHVLTISAPGYLPRRAVVLVAGQTLEQLRVELEPSEAKLSMLEITTNVPDVEIFVDRELAGVSPLAAPLSLEPGAHDVRGARKGYRAVGRAVKLGPGVRGKLELELEVDPGALRSEGAVLDLAVSEPQAEIFIDGVPQGARHSGLRLPAGRHVLRVERAGFFPAERAITLVPRQPLAERVELLPTPRYRADYVRAARKQHTLAYAIGGAGLVVAGAGAGFLIWNAGKERDAERDFDEIADSFESGGACDPAAGLPSSTRATCDARLQQRLDGLDDVRAREKYGWIGAGVGAAAAGVGVYLLLGADDPTRYDPRPDSDVFGAITPRVIWQRDWHGLGASGRF